MPNIISDVELYSVMNSARKCLVDTGVNETCHKAFKTAKLRAQST